MLTKFFGVEAEMFEKEIILMKFISWNFSRNFYSISMKKTGVRVDGNPSVAVNNAPFFLVVYGKNIFTK